MTFFDKHAKGLELHESALLAGLPQAPSEYNPFRNGQAAIERRNNVLQKMYENGYITRSEYADAASKDLGLKRGLRYVQRREPYFFDYVQEKLIELYGLGPVRAGGLRIHTTINPKMQDLAREAINSYYGDPAGPSSAIVSIDPGTGKIKAMASSGTYGERRFNLAAQGHRQPGSAFKTMVLTAAILKGVDPDSTSYTSKPLNIDDPEYGHWEVKTFGNTYAGTISLTRATLASDNSVYAQLILDVGPKNVCKAAKLLGITTKLDCYPAEGLGGLHARRDHAGDGLRLRHAGQRRRAAPANGDRARGVPRRQEREARRARGQARDDRRPGLRGHEDPGDERDRRHRHVGQLGCPAAGKTGTTDEATDAWFVGYTPKLSTSVWVGYPDSRVPMAGALRAAPSRRRSGMPSCCRPRTATARTSRSPRRPSSPPRSSASTPAPAAPTRAAITTARTPTAPPRTTPATASTTRTTTSRRPRTRPRSSSRRTRWHPRPRPRSRRAARAAGSSRVTAGAWIGQPALRFCAGGRGRGRRRPERG